MSYYVFDTLGHTVVGARAWTVRKLMEWVCRLAARWSLNVGLHYNPNTKR